MKKYFFLLITAIIMSVTGIAQTSSDNKIRVIDETYIQSSGNSQFRIITANEKLCSELITSEYYRDHINKVLIYPKTDRLGDYWEYSFYFDNTQRDSVVAWLRTWK